MAFLASENFGGSWTYSYNLAKYLPHAGDGNDVTVIVNDAVAEKFKQLDVTVYPVNFRSGSRFQRVFWEHLNLSTLSRELEPDIFHSTGNILPVNTFRPSVLTVHDFQYRYFPKNFSFVKRNFLRMSIPHSVRTADHIICVSEFTQKDLVELYKKDPTQTSVIYEAGLTEDEVRSGTEESVLRERYNLRKPFILYAGSTFPHKNLDRLVQAYRNSCRDLDVDLVIVGQTFTEVASLTGQNIDAAGISNDRIKRTGFVDKQDLIGLYKIARCYAFPSLFEGFGIPVLEAMQCGCPVVTSNITSLPEIGGDAVLLVDPYDVGSIGNGMVTLITNEQRRKEIIEAGYRQSAKFSWKKMAEETVLVYRSLAARKGNKTS
jgi:glycosyltransferase involved in cell wall biosynthesis